MAYVNLKLRETPKHKSRRVFIDISKIESVTEDDDGRAVIMTDSLTQYKVVEYASTVMDRIIRYGYAAQAGEE